MQESGDGSMEDKVNCGVSVLETRQTFLPGNGGALPTTPHDFKIKEIPAKLSSKLNEKWHSRLPKIHWSNIVRNTHYVCYSLDYKGASFGVGIWSSPVAQNRFADGKEMLELRRMALSKDCPVNTASHFISIMVLLIRKKFPEIKRLISYQDTSVHKGTIYKASGWVATSENKFVSWTTKKRNRNKDQAPAKKIRWERILREGNKTK